MKKFIVFIFLTILFFSCKYDSDKKQDNRFYIFGNTINLTDSTKVYLKIQESNSIIPLDTTFIINNKFQFIGNTNKPEVYGVYIDSLKGFIGFFMENDSITIAVDKNKLGNSRIMGSDLNDEYLSFMKESNQIVAKTNYLFPLFQKARTENDVDKVMEINKKIESIHKENVKFTLDYAKNNPTSYISAFALQTLLNNKSVSTDTIASVYNKFTHEVKKGDFAIEILLYLENQQKLEEFEN